MRIVYCTDSICDSGGIEHVTIAKANALADIAGNEVWILVMVNDRPPFFQLDPRVHLLNLDVNYWEANRRKTRLSRLWVLLGLKRTYKRKLRKALQEIRPDIVISTDRSEKNILASLAKHSRAVFIRELHFQSAHRRAEANSVLQKMFAIFCEFLDSKVLIRRYDRIVTLTRKDKENYWKNHPKVLVLPNPLTSSGNPLSDLSAKTVVSAGRLDRLKNFNALIRAWKSIGRKHPDWKLEIWGNGAERDNLKQSIHTEGLEDSVFLMGATADLPAKLSQASIFAFSSLYEGFAMVLTEAMSCGLPVVSYACPYGPEEIITDGKDGFLIPVGDEDKLTDRITCLIENETIRKEMGEAALEKSKQFEMKQIIEQWMTLFQDLTEEKNDTKA